MEQQRKWGKRCLCGLLLVLGLACLCSALTMLLQNGWSHRHPYFVPREPRVELAALLHKPELTDEDYTLLFHQTGLSPTAVDDLLDRGTEGEAAILETQEGFYSAPEPQCVPMIGGFTCQDLLRDEEGKPVYAVPLAPLRAGDILLSFSTHSLGWRHGHAGLVIDPGAVLEAVQIGVNSYLVNSRHWRSYSNFLVLRVKDAAPKLGQQVADYARSALNDRPYSLLPGLTGPKDQPLSEGPGVHCAYLPWYAWNHFGVDLDANGGPIVTVGDLARSTRLEVVQAFGVDPETVEDRQSGLAA